MVADAISGLRWLRPEVNPDHRGSLDVVYLEEWTAAPIIQWNVVRSVEGVLRGVHVHSTYDETYAVLSGRMFIVLKDARLKSSTFGNTSSRWVDGGQDESLLFVPAGVAHGVYFETAGILSYGLSSRWTGRGEFNCRWDDPQLGVRWPAARPILSERDDTAGTFQSMVAALNAEL